MVPRAFGFGMNTKEVDTSEINKLRDGKLYQYTVTSTYPKGTSAEATFNSTPLVRYLNFGQEKIVY